MRNYSPFDVTQQKYRDAYDEAAYRQNWKERQKGDADTEGFFFL